MATITTKENQLIAENKNGGSLIIKDFKKFKNMIIVINEEGLLTYIHNIKNHTFKGEYDTHEEEAYTVAISLHEDVETHAKISRMRGVLYFEKFEYMLQKVNK